MSEYLNAVRKVWAREHDPATREAYGAMQSARRVLAAASTKPEKYAARKALARAERAYCEAIGDVPIHRGWHEQENPNG